MNRPPANILIVDDDDAIRGLLCTLLDPMHWCALASSAEEAVRLLDTGSFNLVLSDITMPGGSGLELCRHIQRTCPHTVVIMISAMTEIEYAVEAMREGAFDYISKPFDLARVKLAVDRALSYQRAIEDQRRYEQALEERVRIRTSELKAANEDLNSLIDLLYRNYRATLRGLAKTLEARDIETRGHADRVVAYSTRLGKKMGLSSNDLIALEQGAMLHDIGKIGVPDSILLKPGMLTTDEWVKMREHVAHGLRIIEGVEYLAGAGPVIAQQYLATAHHYIGNCDPTTGCRGNCACVEYLCNAGDLLSRTPDTRAGPGQWVCLHSGGMISIHVTYFSNTNNCSTGVCQSNPVPVLSGSATAQYANAVGQQLTAFGTIISCPPNNYGPAECKINGICSYHDGYGLGGGVFGKRTAAGSYDCQ